MVLIRAVANEVIGSGHIMRCMSVACSLEKAGENVRFIVSNHKGESLVSAIGYKGICLNSDYNRMEDEIQSLITVIKEQKPVLLLVDSYYVTKEYFRALSEYVKIAYMDDLNTEYWNVDCLINYNIFAEDMDYSAYTGSKTTLLLSPKYAPLREEFQNINKRYIKETVTDVLVSAGGADPEMITERIIDRVCGKYPDIAFHFVVGALNPRIEVIKKREHGNIVLHINEKHMAALMQKCDIAIAASGSTLYELCACGTPTITFSLADNQMPATDAFDRRGVMISAGDCRGNDEFIDDLDHKLRDLLMNTEKRQALSEKMQTIVDGRGAERLAGVFMGRL